MLRLWIWRFLDWIGATNGEAGADERGARHE